MSEVRNYGFSGSFVLVVRQIKFMGRLFHNFGNFCVMDMADVGEDMVFHLVVEPTGEPVYNAVFGSEVYCGE